MGNLERPVDFCDGCIFGNGLYQADTLKVIDSGSVSCPDLSFTFADTNGSESHTILTPPSSGYDSSEAEATGRAILASVRGCRKPEQMVKERFMGLLGTKTVQICGAFPDQDPKRPVVKRSSDRWKYIEY